jgi:hypothetical protein
MSSLNSQLLSFNRFEKFFLRISNIMTEKKIEELIILRNHLKKSVKGFSSRVIALSIDMLASMCVNKKEVAAITEEAMQEQTTAQKCHYGH